MSTACNWSSMDEKVLFIPDPSTGPCTGSLWGMTVKAKCGLQQGSGYCNVVRYSVRVDQYDDNCNITNGVSSIGCTDIAFNSTDCGGYSNEKNICLSPVSPNWPASWPDGRYRVVVNFYDSNLESSPCYGNTSLFDTLTAYVWRDYGVWSTIDNPCP